MLVVRIELWRGGKGWRGEELARLEISNVGGSELFGDYRVESHVHGERVELREGEVSAHPRRAASVLTLVAKALKSVGYGA